MVERIKKKRVCIITTVHQPLDTRIFYREAISLAKKYEVLIIGPVKDDFEREGIKVKSLGLIANRLQRLQKAFTALRYALKANAAIYHFHDPELIPMGALLKVLSGKPVVYDVHENNPEFILDKEWIPTPVLRRIISFTVRIIENISAGFFDGVIVVNEHLLYRFKKKNKKTELIRNFPKINFGEDFLNLGFNKREKIILFVGGIERDRGVIKILEFIKKFPDFNLKILFVGEVKTINLNKEIISFIKREKISKDRFEIIPRVTYEEVPQYLNRALVGLVSLIRTRNNYLTTPLKMFEYMAYGLPIVASDFLYIRKFLTGSQSGVLIKDPENIDEYKRAFDRLNDSNLWTELSKNSRRAFEQKYNWEKEEKKLLDFYAKLLPE